MANYAQWKAVSTTLIKESKKWKETNDAARVLWLHILLKSDSYGVIEGDYHHLWSSCMKRIGWTLEKTKKALQDLIKSDLIHCWTYEEIDYLHIVEFDLHQPTGFIRSRGRRKYPENPCKTGQYCIPPRDLLSSNYRLKSASLKEEHRIENIELIPKGICAKSDDTLSTVVQEIFDHWCKTDVETGGGRSAGRKLTHDRRSVIKARLKEGHTVEQLKNAITGCCNDPWYQGKNDRKKRYTDLRTIIGNASKVDRALQIFDQQKHRKEKGNVYTNPVATIV